MRVLHTKANINKCVGEDGILNKFANEMETFQDNDEDCTEYDNIIFGI